jgi:bifunctional DNA primase/polymerase-like protein
VSAPVDAALTYARQFGPIWPQTPQKTGYRGSNGSHDATRDEDTIRRWWSLHPEAVPALMTGEPSGIVALDIDNKNGRNGFDSLELLAVPFHPETPTAHTPNGGVHVLFRWPGVPVRSSQDRLGPGLEVKGDGGWITLPPAPGRWWDPHLGIDTPIAPMPTWMVIAEPEAPPVDTPRPVIRQPLSRYGEAALDAAVKAISTAPVGKQRETLNSEAYGIAGLVAGGVIPSPLALEALHWAARRMVTYDSRRPWRVPDLEKIVHAAFIEGLRHPRQPEGRR